MKQQLRKAWKPLAGVSALLLIVVYSGGMCRQRVQPGRVAFERGEPIPPDAELHTTALEEFVPDIEVTGTIHSEEKVNLSARLSAYVREVNVSAGSRVAKGQVLLTLDDRDIREQLASAEAQLRQAQTEYRRARQLLESQATTEQAYLAAETAFNSAKAHVESIQVMLSYTRIESPIDGIVTDRAIEAGDLANPGQVLLSVYDPLRMRLVADVPVRLIDRLPLGAEVQVHVEHANDPFMARVTEIVSEVDPRARTRQVKMRIVEPSEELLPGSFGRFSVPGAARPAILVPASAVFRLGQLEYVQAVLENRAVRRLVKSGVRMGDRVEVVSGLAPGDDIVANPIRKD